MIKKLINLFFRFCRKMRSIWRRVTKKNKRTEKRAVKFLAKIAAQKKEDTAIVVASPGMGDVLYVAAFLPEYQKKNQNVKILMFTPPHLTWIGESFGFSSVYPIKGKYKKLDFMFSAANLLDKAYAHRVFGPLVNLNAPLHGSLTAMSYFREYMFGLERDAEIHYHTLKPATVTCIPDFYTVCKKIAVLNPYSPSCHMNQAGIGYFEKICDLLLAQGYIVYTNVVKDRLPIRHSLELRCSILEFLGISAHIPFIVSARSGLLDLIVQTNIDMFVIYSEAGTVQKNIYSLKDWKCGGFITETTIGEISQDAELSLFQKFLSERAHSDENNI